MAKISIELNESLPFEDLVYEAALSYIANEIPVLPLSPGTKMLPADRGINYSSASLKKGTIDNWFGPGGKYRGYNIGIACGKDGGVMALDIDSKMKKGTTGIDELKKIIDEKGDLPPAPCQRTPSGGFHYIYKWYEGATSSSDKIAPGIDTRGGLVDKYTGHIVAYPSTIDGKMYEWIQLGDVADGPEWLVEKLGSPWQQQQTNRAEQKSDELVTTIPYQQLVRMMSFIDPDDLSYDDWLKIGMALKNVAGDDGYDLWDGWSEQGARRRSNECKSRWKTFEDDGAVGFGTLVYYAKQGGWAPIQGDVINNLIDYEIEERVAEMNKRYAVIRAGKGVMIATFDKNSSDTNVGFLNVGSFSVLLANEFMWINKKKTAMADIWLSDRNRREYYEMGIYPNNDAPPTALNIWNGYSVVESSEGSCEKYLNHMKDIICNGNAEIYEWLLDWMADCVQDARNIKGSCVVLRGIEGCGKGIWANTFGELFGKHYTHIISSENLTTKFNAFLTESVVIFADEVLFPGDRKASNILKGMISETRSVRESKGVDQIYTDNVNHIIIASNEDWIVPAGPQSRRYLVLHVNGTMANNRTYFDAIVNEMKSGGKEKLLYILKERHIKSDLRWAPVTKALVEQRKMSNRHDTIWNFLNEAVERGFFSTLDCSAMVGDNNSIWPKKVNKYELFSEYRVWCKHSGASGYDTFTLPVFLSKMAIKGFMEENKVYKVPPLEDLKAYLSQSIGEI